jgi:LemA protein
MGTALIVIIIILVIVAIIALIAMSSYNGFVKSRNLIQESWRQIDVELNRRYELIPNLIETVRAYAAHERNTLDDITRLRAQAQQLSQQEGALPSQQRADVESALSGAVRNLIVSVEAYPDLKSNVNFLELQKQLAETEDRIAAGRRFYNANVRVYNTKVESVPTNIIANMFRFEKATYFEVNDPSVRQAPSVSFGEIAYRGDPQQQGLPQQPSNQPAEYGRPGSDPLPDPQQHQAPQQHYQAPPQQPHAPPQQHYQPPQPQQHYQPPQPQQHYQAPQNPPQQPGAYPPPGQARGADYPPQQEGQGYEPPQQGGQTPSSSNPPYQPPQSQ